jgi:hypothetical protein
MFKSDHNVSALFGDLFNFLGFEITGNRNLKMKAAPRAGFRGKRGHWLLKSLLLRLLHKLIQKPNN